MDTGGRGSKSNSPKILWTSYKYLPEEGYDIVAVDNYVNAVKGDGVAMPESLRRVEKFTKKKIVFYEVDLCDKKALKACFSKV